LISVIYVGSNIIQHDVSAPFYKSPLATFDMEDRQIPLKLVHNMIAQCAFAAHGEAYENNG
jgi:hypothetical protein